MSDMTSVIPTKKENRLIPANAPFPSNDDKSVGGNGRRPQRSSSSPSGDVALVMSTTTSRTPMLAAGSHDGLDDIDAADEERDEFLEDGLSGAGRRVVGARNKKRRPPGGVGAKDPSKRPNKHSRGQGGKPGTRRNVSAGAASSSSSRHAEAFSGYPEDEGDEEMPRKIRLTIVFTAVFLLVLSFVLVGVTLKMAPVIDQMVRKENEARMKMILDAAAGNSSSSSSSSAASAAASSSLNSPVTTSPPAFLSSTDDGG